MIRFFSVLRFREISIDGIFEWVKSNGMDNIANIILYLNKFYKHALLIITNHVIVHFIYLQYDCDLTFAHTYLILLK